MAGILRGSLYWADLNPSTGREQAGFRPVLIISQTIFNDRSGTVIVMPLTSQSQTAGFPLCYELDDVKLPRRSRVKISQIRTISTTRLKRKAGEVSPEVLQQIIEGLNEIIGG